MWRHSEGNGCGSVEELLEAYVDGELAEQERLGVEVHLAGCGACRRQLELARAVSAELRALPSYDAPQTLIDRVIETAREEERQRAVEQDDPRAGGLFGWLPSWRLAGVGLLAAAALAVALLLTWQPASEAPSIATTGMATKGVLPAEVDEAEIRKAADEARLALAYISRASRRTGLELRDGLVGEGFAQPAAVGLRVLGRGDRPEELGRDET